MNIDQLADAFVHGLLPPEEARAFERRCAESEEAAAALARARARLGLMQALPPAEPAVDLAQRTMQNLEDTDARWRSLRRRAVLSMGLAVAASIMVLVGAGVYYSGLKPTGPDLALLGQRDLLAASNAVLRVRMTDRKAGGAAMPGMPVSVELLAPGGDAVEVGKAQTDARGDAAPSVNLPDWPAGNYTLRVKGGGEVLTRQVTLTRPFRVMLSSDKPIYQPGQTIMLRSLALRTADLKPLADEPATFLLTDPKGNVLFKESARTSKYGIAAAKCELDREIGEGAYTVTCRVGTTESKLTAEVKRYVLPKFTVEVKPHRPYYAPGETAKVTVKAMYTFGKPVAGADVDLRLMASDEGDDVRKQVKTDDRGEAEAEILLPLRLREDAPVRFVAGVTDTAGQSQAKAVTRMVTRSPLRVDVLPEAGTLVPGVPNVVHVLARRVDGEPLAKAAVTVEGGGNRFDLTTDDLGTASFEMTPAPGLTELVCTVQPAGMKPHRLTKRFSGAAADFLLRPGRASYKAGDTLDLTVLAAGTEPVFVDVLRAGQTVLSSTVEVKDGRGTLDLDMPADLAGTLRLVAYRFGPKGEAAARQERLVHVAPAGGLKVKADLDKGEYRPGGEATLRLSLVDEKGNAVPGAVSVAAVDEAVFAVQAQRPGMELLFYTMEQQLMEPVYAVHPWSPQDAPAPARDKAAFAAASKTAPGPLHALAASTFPEKQAAAEALKKTRLYQLRHLWGYLGGITLLLIYMSLYLYLPARAVLLGTGIMAVSLGFGGLVLMLPQSTNTFAFVGAKAGGGGMEMAADGRWGPMRPPLLAREKDMAKGERPPLAPLEPGKGGGVAAPRLRQFFPETMYWDPHVISDDRGVFKPVTIPLADSITTWRLTTSAVSAEGKLGAKVQGLKVFQSFFADLDLPTHLTRGDEVTVPVVVYSYLDRPQTVTLKADARGGLELLGAADATLELGPREVKSVRFPVRAAKAGEPAFKVTARAGAVADAIERVIRVEPDGRRMETVQNGDTERPVSVSFDIPANAIDGSIRAELKVYPSRFSQLVEGLDGIFRMPSGCFEQTSSTTYPNVLALHYLQATKQSAPKVVAQAKQYIHLGYQRLVGFEVPGGGFDWYGRPPGNVGLTAYGLMEFEDMAKVHEVDPNLLSRTRAWLLAQRAPDGSWDGGWKSANGKLGATAYVAWAVFAGGKSGESAQATRGFLLSHNPDTVKDPYVLALVCLALHGLGASDGEQAGYLDALAAMRKNDGEGKVTWAQEAGQRTAFYGAGLSGQVEATATATLALMAGKRHPEVVRQALAWLVSKKDAGGTWHSTQATVVALKALIAGTAAPAEAEDREVRVVVNGKAKTLPIPADQAEVLKRIDLTELLNVSGRNEVRVEGTKGGAAGWQLVSRHHAPEEKAPAPASPLGIAVAYDRTKLEAGGVVKATARAVNNTEAELPMVMLELPVPPGFAADTAAFDKLAADGVIGKYEVRPRSVLVYLRALPAGGPLTLEYTLRARLAVKAEAGPARAWEYYDPAKEARTAAVRFEVAEPK